MGKLMLFIFISGVMISKAFAAMHTIAMILNGVVVNAAVWDDVKSWNPGLQYTLVDVTGTNVGPGYTCVKCDGSDFVAPTGQ